MDDTKHRSHTIIPHIIFQCFNKLTKDQKTKRTQSKNKFQNKLNEHIIQNKSQQLKNTLIQTNFQKFKNIFIIIHNINQLQHNKISFN